MPSASHCLALSCIRKLLSPKTVFLLPRRDRFLNDFLLDKSAELLHWTTGFSGSAGTLIVTPTQAVLCVDGRYDLQAKEELDATLFSVSVAPVTQWLAEYADSGNILIDPWLHSVSEIEVLQKELSQWSVEPLPSNPLLALWTERPQPPKNPIIAIPMDLSFQEKARAVWPNGLEKPMLLCKAEEIAWLCNLRGRDVPYSPLFHGYALISENEGLFQATLFVDTRDAPLLPDISYRCLSEIEGIEDFFYQPKSTPYAFLNKKGKASSCNLAWKRACKTSYEVDEMRKAHLIDGLALVKFLHWLETINLEGQETEKSAADQLQLFRQEHPAYQGNSFETIAAFGAHAAIIHYHPPASGGAALRPGLFLIDSGGQYHYGTTDVTRVVLLGDSASSEQKKLFTCVLQAHIHLAACQFPKGTRGIHLDAAARSFLWQEGLDYPHSTGHGVGLYSSVHEYPPALSSKEEGLPLEKGMIFSNEPGYYLKNRLGIRIESCVVVTEKAPLLCLETLTLAPIDQRLILPSLLSEGHRNWLNTYHHHVYTQLSPFLEEKPKKWLEKATRPVSLKAEA